mmetsp:Transcript_30083/g.41962  ORF Transcript_30083/g.41962 Transcript_30083/m.41962 type:complete len:221 (+) Transcript_30083:75-737(+)
MTSRHLTVPLEGQGVAAPELGLLGRLGLLVLGTTAKTTGMLAGGGEAAELAVLVDGVAQPVDAGIVADSGVHGIDQDDFKVLVGGVLVDPVGVQDTEVTTTATNTLFGLRANVALELDLADTLVGGLTADHTTVVGALAASAADADTVDDVALLGLVSKAAGLVGTSRTAGAVDGGQLAVLPAPHTEEEAKHIRLLLLPEFFEVFVSSHGVFSLAKVLQN